MTAVPGPASKPIIRNLDAIDRERPLQGMMSLAERYGELFRLELPGQARLLVVSSQRIVDEICDESRFDKRVQGPVREVRAFAGDGLFTGHTEEENWGRAHRILMPAFSAVALHGMFDGMSDIAEQLMLKWQRVGPEANVDVVHDFTRLTFDTIALCSFSYRFNSFYSESMHPFVDAMVSALQESGGRARRLALQNRLMLNQQRRYDEDIRVMHKVADELVRHRREHPLPEGQRDILDTMLSARDPQTGAALPDENVRYQLVTFLIAGHETTSGLLSFAVHALLRNPEVLATARAQVEEVLGDRFPAYPDIPKLTYLNQVLLETLRLWPTAPAFAVYPYEPTTIGDGVAVTPDDTIVILSPSLHRDPAVWVNPEVFDPDRFGLDRARELPPNAWKPFGNGQRSCIGRGFALLEAQLVLALLVQNFDFRFADPGYQLKIKETLTWKPEGLQVRMRALRDRPISRNAAAPSAPPASRLASTTRTVQTHGTAVQVLFGSNAGTSEAFARQIAARATALGYAPTVASLDDGVDAVRRDGALIVVTASYEGQPPDNARRFVSWLQNQLAGAFAGVRYAVFGCGNSDWARTYQRIPTLVDDELSRAGATRLVTRGAADTRGDFFGDFEAWQDALWPATGTVLGVPSVATDAVSTGIQVEIVGAGREPLLRADDLGYGTVVVNRELVDMTRPGARSKRHLEIALPEGRTYRTGDYLAVLPLNPSAVVDRALARFDLAYDTRLRITATGPNPNLPTDQPIAAGELFASHLELSRPAGRRHVEHLAEATDCPPEKQALTALASPDRYESEVLDKRLSALDLLEMYPSVRLPLGSYLSMLTPLSPRQYSISSSPLWSPDHVTLTVAHVDAPALSGSGRYEGVASTFLAHSRPGTRVPVTVRPSNIAFHPPEDLATPVVMICAGTGLAPFRGFLQDRALRAQQQQAEPARALLFFGCDAPDVDLLYPDELRAWQEQGIVSIRAAFSEAPEDGPDGPVRFVQDRLWADRDDVADLVRRGATVYVCGDGRRMAPAVHQTCVRIYAEHMKASLDEAEAWMDEMERAHGRYVSDVFA
ncbi:bifunctional cytochrome P450/NADPH--P450 reductase [Actinoplanes subtropicus]|uniref:bifunctional cytochrome P450/NADPH--P450 reductase n=1 Tax=Actinoplanes subtropicus TaxID=543632 RepID=UPI0004C2EAC6|nr:cytochrome P450 [Actinoplanes subtropicus]